MIALIFHGVDITLTMRSADGWDLGLFSTLSITTWLMAVIALFVGKKFNKAHPGIIIYPLVALSLILKQSLPSDSGSVLSVPALEWHILLSLAAYSLFTLAAIQAIILSIQEQQLRQRHLAGLLSKLPPLQSMESWLFQLIMVGFLFLTLGLITGIVFLEDIFFQHLLHKTILSFIAWSVFASLLWGRRQYGWRGRNRNKMDVNWLCFFGASLFW